MSTGEGSLSMSPLGPLPKDPVKRLRKAAAGLEAVWLTQVLKEARPKGGVLDKSFAASTFRDMLDQTLAQSMADRGVMGLADALVQKYQAPATPPHNLQTDKGSSS